MKIEAPTSMAARLAPDRPALSWKGTIFTNRELETMVIQAAGSLRRLGVKPADVVAVWSANSLNWVLAAHALGRLGAVLLPLNTRLTDEEAGWQLEKASVALVLVDDAKEHSSLSASFCFFPLNRLLDDPHATEIDPCVDPERPHSILFTSGSTGRPKGVVLSWANQHASAMASAKALGLEARDRWLLAMPMFHVGGLNILFRCAWSQASVALLDRFEPVTVLSTLQEQPVTVVSVVPAMLRRLLDMAGPEGLPPSVRAVLVGGAATPPDLLERCPAALATYGLTEACSHVTLVRPGASPIERATSGPPLEGTAVRIVDEAGHPLETGAEGLITVQGPTIFATYLGMTESPLKEGWFSTGDWGRMDERGCLQVLARRTDLIVSGGENIYPAEIEALLERHPQILEAAVTPLDDPQWGQVPKAFVVLREGTLDLQALQAFLAPHLARYKLPKALEIVPSLPRLANGKIDRRAIFQMPEDVAATEDRSAKSVAPKL